MTTEQWAPPRIWLQREQGDHGMHTWCEDSVGDGDIIEEAEYVRVDRKATDTNAASIAFENSKYYFTGESPVRRIEDWRVWIDAWNAALSASQPKALPNLAVWYGPMPESNGKTNWTAILHAGEIWKGITIDRSEYPDRVRYEADRMRWMIGELDKEPSTLDYDADKHSGYVPPVSQPKALTDEKIDAAILEWFSYERNQDDFRARMRAAIIAATEAK